MMAAGDFAKAFGGLVRGAPLDVTLFTLTMFFAAWGLLDLLRGVWQWLARNRNKN